MSEEFKLPSLGEGVSEADIADIMVAAGDSVEPGQVLMELETEKAVMELPLELPGAVQIDKLLVASGDTVKVGQVLFTYSAGGGASPAPAKAEPKQAESAKEAPAPAAAAPAAAATIVESTGPITFVLPSLG
ncbi:MAG: pyruvate dehydrogenase, partial [Planctomycetaceae bacterium]|nr:pyruvate dehydrogenase [Planctomycetaceae bacterium]